MRKTLALLAVTVMILSSPAYAEVEVERDYYRSGQLYVEVNFKDSKQEGLHKGYYESGNVKYIDTYENGKWIHRKSYGEDGKLESDRDIPKLESERDYIQW